MTVPHWFAHQPSYQWWKQHEIILMKTASCGLGTVTMPQSNAGRLEAVVSDPNSRLKLATPSRFNTFILIHTLKITIFASLPEHKTLEWKLHKKLDWKKEKKIWCWEWEQEKELHWVYCTLCKISIRWCREGHREDKISSAEFPEGAVLFPNTSLCKKEESFYSRNRRTGWTAAVESLVSIDSPHRLFLWYVCSAGLDQPLFLLRNGSR